MNYVTNLLAVGMALACASSEAMDAAKLRAVAEQRLLGDRTGACVAIAVIDEKVSKAYVCADKKNENRISPKHAFEIGSVSKTMTAALLADLILQKKANLDDPLADYLPSDMKVPMFEGKPILLKHIVTHTSGLPASPDFSVVKDQTNPYADMTEATLFKTLNETELNRVPGSQFEYSNFATMIMSNVIAKRTKRDFETLMRERLFKPLGMTQSYINQKPSGVIAAVGHTPNQKTTSAWTFQTNSAGVGGVRATLDDMVKFVQAQLNLNDSSVSQALALSQAEVATDANQKFAMNWKLAPLDSHFVHVHEGGTGGFSSLVAFDTSTHRGVVLLSDTALTSVGGLSSLGNHLLDQRLPLGKPRKQIQPDAELLNAIVGQYDLTAGMQIELTQRDKKLFAKATGQNELELGYDSAGDFYPLEVDASIRTKKLPDGKYSLMFLQNGGAYAMKKMNDETHVQKSLVEPQVATKELEEFVGLYPLAPNFDLKIFIENSTLMAQATGQGAFELVMKTKDSFTADAYGIEITFLRNNTNQIEALNLIQGGRTTKSEKRRD